MFQHVKLSWETFEPNIKLKSFAANGLECLPEYIRNLAELVGSDPATPTDALTNGLQHLTSITQRLGSLSNTLANIYGKLLLSQTFVDFSSKVVNYRLVNNNVKYWNVLCYNFAIF